MPGFELFGNEERKEVNDVLESGVLMRYGFDGMRNGHWKAKEFEKAFGAGDEVIMPTFTFVASFESIMALGAVPVLVDIDDTLTLDPAAVEKAITSKTKCIMPVHMCGSMADLAALKRICNKHNLLLLEDACQATGGSFDGKPLGAYGDLGCFSFDFVKTITCGEGGAVITNNEKYYINADQFQDHGHDHIGNDRGAETHPHLGYNLRISELNAAVGVAQLRKLDDFLAIQKRNYTIIRNALSEVDGVTFRRVPETGVENYSFVNFFLPNTTLAEKAHKALNENGVDACFYWFKNNWHYIKGWEHLRNLKSLAPLPNDIKSQIQDLNKTDFSKSDTIMGRTISSLVKLSWTEEQVKERASKMAQAIQSVL